MKLTPDRVIRTAYRVTKAQITKRRKRGARWEDLMTLVARREFLERLYDL